MNHVILLGDSIFDNERYVPNEAPVIDQLNSRLPSDWRATLLAVDGAICEDVPIQMRRLPEDASHLIISVGGNDALGNSHLIEDTRLSAAEGFVRMAVIQQEFRQNYQAMLHSVLAVHKPTILCTIYDAVPGLPDSAVTALSGFNDVICQEAFQRGLPVLDLRLICDEATDYSVHSPIEPSAQGGIKIVLAMVRTLLAHDFNTSYSVVYGKA